MISEAVLEGRAQVLDVDQSGTFLRLIEEYGPALRRLAGAYVEQAMDREDLFQEIAAAIWQALPKFRGESSRRTWLYRIAHNVAISSAARLHRRTRTEENFPEHFDHPSPASDAEQEILQSEKVQALNRAIRELAVIDRQIVLLHLEGLGYAEIEAVSGLSESAIATRLTRIREKLKKKIHGKEADKP